MRTNRRVCLLCSVCGLMSPGAVRGEGTDLRSIAMMVLMQTSSIVPVPGSPMAFMYVPVPDAGLGHTNPAMYLLSSGNDPDRRSAETPEPGMFTCERNGVVSRIGAVGCPEGRTGTFVVRPSRQALLSYRYMLAQESRTVPDAPLPEWWFVTPYTPPHE